MDYGGYLCTKRWRKRSQLTRAKGPFWVDQMLFFDAEKSPRRKTRSAAISQLSGPRGCPIGQNAQGEEEDENIEVSRLEQCCG